MYKLHYVTSNFTNPTHGQFHEPPLIYHIEHDPGENYPLDSNSDEYRFSNKYFNHLPILSQGKNTSKLVANK